MANSASVLTTWRSNGTWRSLANSAKNPASARFSSSADGSGVSSSFRSSVMSVLPSRAEAPRAVPGQVDEGPAPSCPEGEPHVPQGITEVVRQEAGGDHDPGALQDRPGARLPLGAGEAEDEDVGGLRGAGEIGAGLELSGEA